MYPDPTLMLIDDVHVERYNAVSNCLCVVSKKRDTTYCNSGERASALTRSYTREMCLFLYAQLMLDKEKE